MKCEDITFLLDCASLDDFKVQCTLAGIDMKEAVKKLSFFNEKRKYYSIALNHFYWFDANGEKIDAPQKVNGTFDCSDCNSLTSLEGAPQEVNGTFDCSDCNSLTSLEGAPQNVGRDFNCSHCNSLTSLEGAPKEVGGSFDCSYCNSLTSLEGAPKEVSRNFFFINCKHLTREQINAYRAWLETNPSQPYHEIFVKKTNESIELSEELVYNIMHNNKKNAFSILHKLIEKTIADYVSKRIVLEINS